MSERIFVPLITRWQVDRCIENKLYAVLDNPVDIPYSLVYKRLEKQYYFQLSSKLTAEDDCKYMVLCM